MINIVACLNYSCKIEIFDYHIPRREQCRCDKLQYIKREKIQMIYLILNDINYVTFCSGFICATLRILNVYRYLYNNKLL